MDKRVIDLVGEFRCDTCEERKRPAPRRVATLEVHPARWKVMLADGAHWVHPVDKTRNIIGLYMDQNSRFLVGKILIQHKSSLPDAQSYVRFFNEHWQQYFGRPELLRFDAEGTWRSKSLDAAFSDLGIMLDPIPGDAHWHISPLERSIAWVKECLSKLVSDNPKLDSHVALACALEAWNNREVVRGYSPRQHALGQAPDPCGRIFETDIQGLPTNMMGNPEGELAQHQRMRVEAEVAFTRWQAQQRVTRALNSRSRKVPEFAPGDLVYYWRTQLRGHHAAGEPIQTGTNAGYAGPARILAMETRRDGAQQVRPSSIVWLIRNNWLLKASVEQLRFASQREQALHEFDRPQPGMRTSAERCPPFVISKSKENFLDGNRQVDEYEDDNRASLQKTKEQSGTKEVQFGKNMPTSQKHGVHGL